MVVVFVSTASLFRTSEALLKKSAKGLLNEKEKSGANDDGVEEKESRRHQKGKPARGLAGFENFKEDFLVGYQGQVSSFAAGLTAILTFAQRLIP